MTKTLTEQWREGELFGLHYVKIPKEEVCIHNVSCMDYLLDEYGVEVLERVPSYEEYNELLRHSELSRNLVYEVLVNQKEYKRLQEQLKEANEIISLLFPLSMNKERAIERTTEYMEKWGVK